MLCSTDSTDPLAELSEFNIPWKQSFHILIISERHGTRLCLHWSAVVPCVLICSNLRWWLAYCMRWHLFFFCFVRHYGAPFVKILYLTDLAQKLLSLAEIAISACRDVICSRDSYLCMKRYYLWQRRSSEVVSYASFSTWRCKKRRSSPPLSAFRCKKRMRSQKERAESEPFDMLQHAEIAISGRDNRLTHLYPRKKAILKTNLMNAPWFSLWLQIVDI